MKKSYFTNHVYPHNPNTYEDTLEDQKNVKEKKVKFTPTKIKKKNNNITIILKLTPKNKPHHKQIPVKIPKTAPKLKT